MKINDLSEKCVDTANADTIIVNADGTKGKGSSVIVVEHYVDLYVNDVLVAKLVCTPSNLVEMIVGRLITERIIGSVDELNSISISRDKSVVNVVTAQSVKLESFIETELTSCPGNKMLMKSSENVELTALPQSMWKTEWIFGLANAFANGSVIHKSTKGTHSCYLSVHGEIVYASEDIGRHNALDKAVGYAAMQGYEPSKCILFTTGRVPTDMVMKAVAAGIGVLVSKAVPTKAAVQLARKYNLTLICKAWPDRFEIFSGNL